MFFVIFRRVLMGNSLRRKSGSLITLGLVLFLFSSAVVSATPVPEKLQTLTVTRTLPQSQYIPDHDFDTRHIALDLRFDWDKEQLIGREMLVFAPLVANLRSIKLDAANITATSVKLSTGTTLQFVTDPTKEKVTINLDRAYQPSDELTLLIEYHTNGPQDNLRPGLTGLGLKFIKPNPDDPKRPKQLWSQGESEYNHYWFLCYDHPNDFFTSEVTATVEKPLIVVSNGSLLETKDNKDGTRTFHWKIDQPHASYLTSIVVGEYTPIVGDYLGIPIITNVYPSEVAEGRLTAARLPEMVKFFSEKTGLKYPYAKYAQTTARDFGGGMENISATTQTDNMIHDARAELDSTSDGLESHELAHQWFGDYVTARNWSDIWLNESFATYFQAMWDEYKLGRDDFLYSDIKANQDSYFAAWKQGNRRPIVTKNYTEPDAVFDTYAYPRGGAVLHMLRKDLGEENWWRAINYYLHKYAHQPVETEQFRIAIEESTGQSMEWFFDEWLYRMGHPIFNVSQQYDEANKTLKLTVAQQQKMDPSSQYPQVDLFQTPVEIEIGTATQTNVERVQIEPQREQTFTFKVDSKPLLVNFDYNSTLIKELVFNKSTDELSYQLERDQDVLGRVWALDQLKVQLKNASTPSDQKDAIANAIVRAVTTDKFWGVRAQGATALAEVPGAAVRSALLAAAKDSNPHVRVSAISALAASKDPTLANVYADLLKDPSYGVVRAASSALVNTKDSKAYDEIAKLLEGQSWHDTLKATALSSFSLLGDKRSLAEAFKYVEPGNYPQVRAAALRLLGVVGKDDPRSISVLTQTLESAFKRQDATIASASAEGLANLGNPQGLLVFDRLSKEKGSPQLSRVLTRFQDQLKKAVATTEKSPTQQP
ncbi:MAG: hypothetical protein C5B55_14855 [Blastocatellia bacterium]|nr:MAG: hypothetical protein C5B55_14855 [Blastocatellia bacterium]